MIVANTTFYGQKNDGFGMPISFNSYFVVASKIKKKDWSFASAVYLTEKSKTHPEQVKTFGEPEKAFEEIIKKLRSLPQNKDLMESIERK